MNQADAINNFLEIDFFEQIEKPSTLHNSEIRIFGEIFEGSLDALDEIFKTTNSDQQLEFLINSGGGSVFDGVAMASLIKRHNGSTVGTGIGFVASIASIILLSTNKVRLNRDAFLMIHNASIGFTYGEAEELRKDADILDKISNQLSEVYVAQIEKNGKLIEGNRDKTKKQIKKMMNAETWFTAEEALEVGLIDEIADVMEIEPLTDDQINVILNKYGKTAPKEFLNMCNCEDKDINNGASLSALLNRSIDSKTDDDTTRGDIIEQMASAANISASTVRQILAGEINCPPLSRLEGFARALDISINSITSAANRDGCNYEENKNTMEIESNDNSFVNWLKNLFKNDPSKVEEVKNEVEKEINDEKTTAIEEAKQLLTDNGFAVLTEEEADNVNNEIAIQNVKVIEANEKFEVLQEEYDEIMNKLREFEQQYSAQSGKTDLNNEEVKPEKKSERELLLEKYANNSKVKNSKFFKNLSK